MNIEVIPLSQLQIQTPEFLTKRCDSGQALVVELPDHRLVAIQPLDAEDEDDSLVSELIETNPAFRALLERSRAGTRKPFPLGR